ncbi:Protein of unknown function [Pyronema omphalodes CBS 100304]|uniref:Uncharacterized protein n=1 Tax=Pyronema omphalodes (strain CBS 100304) TaxID=1076935 RepID=U4L435_PYROM|nr:Protein of unknown function [Pyronema omphalodes CBS 100304]
MPRKYKPFVLTDTPQTSTTPATEKLAETPSINATTAIQELVKTLTSPPLPPHKRAARLSNDDRKLTIIPSGPRAINEFKSVGQSSGIEILAKDIITGGEGYVMLHLKKMLKLSYLTWQLFLDDEKIRPKALAEVCEKWWQTGSFTLHFVHRDDTVVWDYILRPNAPDLPWRSAFPKHEKDSYRELTVDRYGMPNPFSVEHSEDVWKGYLETRLRLDYQQLKRRSLWFNYNERPKLMVIRDTVSRSFTTESAPAKIAEKLCDNVVMIKCNDKQIIGGTRKLTVFTRVYLPNSLSFYEVAYYEHIKEMCQVTDDSYGVAFGYRLVTDPTQGCDFRYIERLWSRGVPQMFHRESNGWCNVFYALQNKMENDEHEEWGFDIDSSDVEELVEAFGLQPAVVMRYLFAAVGGYPGVDEHGVRSDLTYASMWKLTGKTLEKKGIEFEKMLGDKMQAWCWGVECDKSSLHGPKEEKVEEAEEKVVSVEAESVDDWGNSGHGFSPPNTCKKTRQNQSHTAPKAGNVTYRTQPRANKKQDMPSAAKNTWGKPKKAPVTDKAWDSDAAAQPNAEDSSNNMPPAAQNAWEKEKKALATSKAWNSNAAAQPNTEDSSNNMPSATPNAWNVTARGQPQANSWRQEKAPAKAMAWNVIAGRQRKEHSQGQENAPSAPRAGNFTKTQPKKDQVEAPAVKDSSEENDAAYWREYDRRQKECAKMPHVKVPKDHLLKVKESWMDSEDEAELNKMPDDPWAQCEERR